MFPFSMFYKDFETFYKSEESYYSHIYKILIDLANQITSFAFIIRLFKTEPLFFQLTVIHKYNYIWNKP